MRASYCWRCGAPRFIAALSQLFISGFAVTTVHTDRQPRVSQSEVQPSRNRLSLMRRQDSSPSYAPSGMPAVHTAGNAGIIADRVSAAVPVPVPCPPGEGANDPHSPNYDCTSYMEATGCSWTVEYGCPDQHAGSIGAAEIYFADTTDYGCCCLQGLWKVTETIAHLQSAIESSPIAGILQGTSKRPKLILAQDVDWPPYAYIGKPPESDYDVAGIAHDIAVGMGELCNLDIQVVQTPWANCWDGSAKPWPKIGKGLEEGWYHGCMTYTHPSGMRGRFLEWSYSILKKNKPAGLLALLNPDGRPKVNPNTTLEGLKVVDVAGWAPLSDGMAFVKNKCTGLPFKNYSVHPPTDAGGNAIMGNDAAMTVLRNGGADVMFVYADQAHNYECTPEGTTHSGATPTWNCSLWAGFGTQYAYIQMGMLGYMINGTTLTMSRKGSGLPELVNPCLTEFMGTVDYYNICEKHHLTNVCFPNKHFPLSLSKQNLWDIPTNLQQSGCASGYCGCS